MEIRKLMEEMKDVLFILLVTAFFTWIANCIQLPKVNMAESSIGVLLHGLRHSGFAPAGLSYSPDGLLGIDHRSGYLAAGLPGRRLGHPLYEAGRVPAHHDAGACLLRPVARQGYRRL